MEMDAQILASSGPTGILAPKARVWRYVLLIHPNSGTHHSGPCFGTLDAGLDVMPRMT